jgi:uncharacterized protein YhhL (DUF1145 family)
MQPLNTALRMLCLLAYLMAAGGPLLGLSPEVTLAMQIVAVILLLAHLLELPFVMPHVQRYQGPLAFSVLLTLLFGLLHWLPLKRDQPQGDKLRP